MNQTFRIILPLLAASVLGLGQTGPNVPELAPLERAVTNILTKYKIPGAAVSVAKEGKLVYTRGFGIADIETGEPVQPDSLFRVASVSKPITAMGVLKLVEEGKISLDTKVLSFIGRKVSVDNRYNDITVRHLLQHSSGMDIEFWELDPSFPSRQVLEALGASLPPSRADVLDFVLENLPLAFAPGSSYAYSNIGYMFLTEVIEKASGQPYEAYMREKILAPIGISRMKIGGSLLSERQPGEVRYWDKDRKDAPIFEELPETVPQPYGTFSLRIFESGGGWIASMPDLVRFLTAFDNGSSYPILRPETVRLIAEKPAIAPAPDYWPGLGWFILRTPLGERWDHSGALQGTSAWMFRGINGVSFAIAANHLPDDEVLEEFLTEFESSLTAATLSITRWPTSDTFATYFPGRGPRISEAGLVNGASLRPGPVAAGSVVRLFGVNLNGGIVRVNGVTAETLWSDAAGVNVRVPMSANGNTQFQVDNQGLASNVITISVQNVAPGIFTVSRNGYGQAAALNPDNSANSVTRPAAAGSVVALYVTGVATPVVTIDGLGAEVLYSGPAPGLAPGIMQVNVRVPMGASGGWLPVLVKSGEVSSQVGATLAVR